MEEFYLALQMRLRRGERGSVSAIDAKSDPQLWLPQKEESKMTSRRHIFKLLAGAAIAPKIAAQQNPKYVCAGLDMLYGRDIACIWHRHRNPATGTWIYTSTPFYQPAT